MVFLEIIVVYYWSHSKRTNAQLESAGFCLNSNAGGMHTTWQPLRFQRLNKILCIYD